VKKKIGFVGAGKMAQAMMQGMVRSETIPKENIMASARTAGTTKLIEQKYEIGTSLNNRDVAMFADILILAVKPDLYTAIIKEIKDDIKQSAIIITIAAGITLKDIEDSFGFQVKAVRTMPNTPSVVGEGMSVICANDYLTEDEIAQVELLFQTFSKTERLEENLMDAVPAISGSSPAYVYMLIEAMADGGVRQGIPRGQSYRLAAQAVLGAAKMVLETGKHPGELKDNVCTPGGATIEAVITLEEKNFRGSIMAAMDSCTTKVKNLI